MQYNKMWLTGLTALALAGCGGGGGGVQLPSINLVVTGLQVGNSVAVRVEGSSTGFAQNVGVASAGNTIAAGTSVTDLRPDTYAVSVASHPVRQLCDVIDGSAVVVNASSQTVHVQCSVTYLNDTGITAVPAGVSNSDAVYGRDAQALKLSKIGAGMAGFDYTKLCEGGELVDASGACPINNDPNNAWACNRDNVTGLVWAKSTTTMDTSPAAPADMCGYTDWREPTVHELVSLVHSGRTSGASFDTNYFTGNAGVYIASELYLGGMGRWFVDFAANGAASDVSGVALDGQNVRYVASSSRLNATTTYKRVSVGTEYVIVDTDRDLMWLISTTPLLTDWEAALSSASALNLANTGGYNDWRLPNKNELDSLVDRSAVNPAVDASVYGDASNALTFSQSFWSNSPVTNDNKLSWAMNLQYGDILPKARTDSARVVYVRNRVFGTTP